MTDTATTDTDLGRVAFMVSRDGETPALAEKWDNYPILQDAWTRIAAAVRAEVERDLVAQVDNLITLIQESRDTIGPYEAGRIHGLKEAKHALAALKGEQT